MREGNLSPRVSIVMSTCRLGGIDVIIRTCLDQTERDFELILVDYWWDRRDGRVAEAWYEAGLDPLRLVHVPPRRKQNFPDASMAYNTGIALARGELVVFTGDNVYGPPKWLEHHYAVAEALDWKGFLCAPFRKFAPPPLAENPTVLSLFAELFHPSHLPRRQLDASYKMPAGMTGKALGAASLWRVSDNYFHLTKNESVSLEALYAINGCDEVFDGYRGYADQDVESRLVKLGYFAACFNGAVETRGIEYSLLPEGIAVPGHAINASPAALEMFESRRADPAVVRAENGGFDVSAPFAVEDAVWSWEHSR